MRRLAIDPGDIHVGWSRHEDGWAEAVCGEWRPMEAADKVWELCRDRLIDELIIEEFVLYDREYANQTWSPMKTSQLIGQLKFAARGPRGSHGIEVVEQGAYIKKAIRRQLVARGIRQTGEGSHARDAELHLWYRVLRSRG